MDLTGRSHVIVTFNVQCGWASLLDFMCQTRYATQKVGFTKINTEERSMSVPSQLRPAPNGESDGQKALTQQVRRVYVATVVWDHHTVT